ncbi:MAG: hypothetical protein E7617_04560 [Ruminococcaceae bacterium]|nr:hypothetical protein [Oscillospiraceae bacterium]
MKRQHKLLALVVMLILLSVSLVAVIVSADSPADAMTEIEAALSDFKVGTTTELTDDGYIGIPMEISAYFDAENHIAKTDYMANGGTPVIIYVVNTRTVRTGTETDVNIIRSMLERGYIVTVFDYLNHAKAVSPAIDWSVQLLRKNTSQGKYFNGGVIPTGTYPETFVAPAGCNVSLGNVFWEADKHGADGTLEKVVETWNNDFRAYHGEKIVKWVDSENNRKSTRNGIKDDTAPIWYSDAAGKTVNTDGTGVYTKVKYTWANDIHDCVNPDGTPVDLNLYINIVYPDSPTSPVPVVSLSNSSTFPTSGITSADQRPHTNGFLFNGYASVVFDYLWQPMARAASYDYFDGQTRLGGYTGDQMNYSLMIYNDKRVYTAAMRYLRYINNENQTEFNFNEDAFGVYGNSKGGWFTFLGSEELHDYTPVPEGMELAEAMDARINSYTSKREFPHHAGETYYQNGKTSDTARDGILIDGGELQPWLTYASGERAGEEILAYANVLYACCGPAYEDMDIGGAPIFITSNMFDNYSSAWGSSNIRINLARALDTPSLAFESPVGHMLTHSKDITHGVDTYDAFFDFFGYYLKGENTKVVYTTPLGSDAGVSVTDPITVKFIGSIDASEIAKVTILDSQGNAAVGTWSSLYGNTEWTFTPSEPLRGGMTYTVTVPASVRGDNETTLASDYMMSFTTESEVSEAAEVDGLYITSTVPALNGGNGYAVTFNVSNDAANIASLYAVAAKGDTTGTYLGSVNLSGKGLYSIDATGYLSTKTVGEEVIFLVKAEKSAGVSETFRDDFAALAKSGYTDGNKSRFANYVRSADSVYAAGEKYSAVNFDGASAVRFIVGMNGSRYPNNPEYEYDNEFYARLTQTLFTDNVINGGEKLTKDDYGRKFTITMRIYDTTSRDMLLYLESMSGYYLDNAYDTMDYNHPIKRVNTVAGEWIEITVDYTVYESDFGVASDYEPKRLMLETSPEGYMENGDRVEYPMYVDYISVKETVTDIEISSAHVAVTDDGGKELKASVNAASPVALYSGETLVSAHASLGEALAAYKIGYTVRLLSDITITDANNSAAMSSFTRVDIDLNGYRIVADTEENGVIWLSAASVSDITTVVNVYGGSIYMIDAPLVTFGGTTALGEGRAFKVNFTDVYFGIIGRTMAANIAASTDAEGYGLKASISFDDCIFGIKKENLPYITTTLFGKSDVLDLSYTVKGGELRLASERWLKVINDLKTVTFLPDANSKLTSLILPNAYAADTSVGYYTEMGTANYVPSTVGAEFTEYELNIGELSTKYGMIPEEYASVDDYPAIIFDGEGNFIKAYNTFHGPLNYFATYSESESDEWFIVLRRDITHSTKFDNLSKGKGSVTYDLGGHTVTCDGTMLYNADAKTNGDITVHTINGNVAVTSLGAIRILGWKVDGYDISQPKAFNFDFTNVEFKLASGATTTSLVTYNYERGASSAGPATNEMTFTDCKFDISGASAAVTLFTVGNYNGGQVLTGNYTLNGCEIIADNGSYLNVYELKENTGSSIYFNKNEDGEYLKITLPTGDSVPANGFESANGIMQLEAVGTSGDNTVYTLTKSSLSTPYGNISKEYASIEDYPWVVFDKSGRCLYGGTLFTTEVSKQACAAGDGAVIYLRRNFNMDTDKQASGANSISTLNGTITVDLGGNTLTMGNGGSADGFIRCEAHIAGYVSIINVINGKIIGGKDPVVRYASIGSRFSSGYDSASATNPHKFYVTLDSLEISWDAAESGTRLISYGGASGTVAQGFNNNLIVKDCELTIRGMTDKHYIVSSVNNVPINATVVGCTVSHDGGGTLLLTSMGTGSVCTYAKGKDGKYIELTIPTGSAIPTVTYGAADDAEIGNLRLSEYAVEGTNTVYRLLPMITPYGEITSTYVSALKYPWVVFDKDGTCVYAGTAFTTTVAQKACAAGDGAVIYLRRDFDMDTNKQSSGAQSISTLNGSLTVDLAGFTVNMGNGGSADGFIRAEAYACGYNSYITVKNGKFIVGKDPIVRFSAITGRVPTVTLEDGSTVSYFDNTDYSKLHNFYIILDGLDFVLTENTALLPTYALLYTQASSGYTQKIHNNNVIVRNCNIDVTGCQSTSMKIWASHVGIGANVKLIGGKVVFGSVRPAIQGMNVTSGSTFCFEREDGINYTTFVFPKTHTKPTTVYYTENGTALVFHKISEDGKSVVYRMMPEAAAELEFVPEASITLGSELTFNIYIPIHENLTALELDGAAVDMKSLTEKDGYYLVTVTLGAREAARNISLVATLRVNGETLRGRFNFSIPRYAEKLLSDSKITSVEKTLVKDVLSYVKAAYAYFGTTDAEALAKIDELLGENYDEGSAPVMNGSAEKPTLGITAVTYNLTAKPGLRFYLAEGFKASDFAFSINGKAVAAEEGSDANGKYVEVKLYAYELAETVDYTVNGESDSCHIRCYYEWAKTENNDNLVKLVLRFAKYCESAADYRRAVIGVEN